MPKPWKRMPPVILPCFPQPYVDVRMERRGEKSSVNTFIVQHGCVTPGRPFVLFLPFFTWHSFAFPSLFVSHDGCWMILNFWRLDPNCFLFPVVIVTIKRTLVVSFVYLVYRETPHLSPCKEIAPPDCTLVVVRGVAFFRHRDCRALGSRKSQAHQECGKRPSR